MQSPVISIQLYLIFSHLPTSLQFQQGYSLNKALIHKARYPSNHIEGPTKGGYEPYLSNGIGSPFIQTEITNTVDIVDGMPNNAYLRSLVSNIISDVADPYHTELPDALSYPTPNTMPNIGKSMSGGERSIANLGLTNLDGLHGVDMNQIATGVVEISSQPSGIHEKRVNKLNQAATSQFLDVLGRGVVLSERRHNSKPQGSSRSFTVQSSHSGVQRLLDQQTANARRAPDQRNSLHSPVRRVTGNRSPQPQPTSSQHRGRSQASKLNPKPLAGLQMGDQVFRIQNSNASNVTNTQISTSVIPSLSPDNRTSQQGNAFRQLSNTIPPVEVPITNTTRTSSPPSPPSPQSNTLNVISSSRPKTSGQQFKKRVQQSTKNITTQQVTARNKNVSPKTNLSTSQIQRASIHNVPKILLRHPTNPPGTVSNLNKTETAGRRSMNEVRMGSARPNHMHQQPQHIREEPLRESGMNLIKTKAINGQRKPRDRLPSYAPRQRQRASLNQVGVNNSNVRRKPHHITDVSIRGARMNSIQAKPPPSNMPTRRNVSFNIPGEPQRTSLNPVVNNTRQARASRQVQISRTANSQTSGPPSTSRQQPRLSSHTIQRTRQSKTRALAKSEWNTPSRSVQRNKRPVEPIQQVLRHPMQSSRAVWNRKINTVLRKEIPQPIRNPTAIPVTSSIRDLSKIIFGKTRKSTPVSRSTNSMRQDQRVRKNNEAMLLPPLPSRAVINPALPSVSSAAIQQSNQVGRSASTVPGLTSQTVSGGTGVNTAARFMVANATTSVTAPTITNGLPSTRQIAANLATTHSQGGQPSSISGQKTVIVPSVVSNNLTATPTPPTSIIPTGQPAQSQLSGTQNTLPQTISVSQNVSTGKASITTPVASPVSIHRTTKTVIPPLTTAQVGSTLQGTQMLSIPGSYITTQAGVLTNVSQIGGLTQKSHIAQPINFTSNAAQTVSLNRNSAYTSSSAQNTATQIVPATGNSQIGSSVPNSIVAQATANLRTPAVRTGVAASGVGTPGVALPGTAASGVGTPGVAALGVGTPGVAASGVGTSGVAASGVGTSGVAASGVGTSGVAASGVGTSGVAASGVGTSGVAASGVGTPGVAASGVATSGVAASGVGTPGMAASGVATSGVIASGVATSAGKRNNLPQSILSSINIMVKKLQTGTHPIVSAKQKSSGTPQKVPINPSSSLYPVKNPRNQQKSTIDAALRTGRHTSSQPFMTSSNIIDGPSRSLSDGVRLDGNQNQFYNPWSSNGIIDNSIGSRHFRPTHQLSRSSGPRRQEIRPQNEARRHRPNGMTRNHPESMNVVNYFNPLSPSIRNVRVTQAFF